MAQNDYNNTLQDNNNLLEDILDMINNFPTQKEIELQSKTVSPTTSQQIITPDANYDGLDKVTINAATKQSKTVNPSTSAQTITPDSGYYGLSDVTVNAATIQSKTVTPSASTQTITPDNGYYGLSSVTVNGDSDLVASNIRNGANIFGVTGSYQGADLNNLSNQTSSSVVCTKSGSTYIFQIAFSNAMNRAVYLDLSLYNDYRDEQCELFISRNAEAVFTTPLSSPGLFSLLSYGTVGYTNNNKTLLCTFTVTDSRTTPILNSFASYGVIGSAKVYYI